MADVNVSDAMIDFTSNVHNWDVIVSGCNPPTLFSGCAYINKSYSLNDYIYLKTSLYNTLTWSNQIWHHFCLHVQL